MIKICHNTLNTQEAEVFCMFSSIRLQEIFDLLSEVSYVSANELAKKFHVTERTIRSDIINLNAELQKYKCEILLKRKKGYYLYVHDQEKYNQLFSALNPINKIHSLDSLNDRINYILKILLYSNHFIHLEDLADQVYVSRNTLQNYTKSIKEIVEKYNLAYVSKTNYGVKILGSEKNKRQCLIENFLSRDMPDYVIGYSLKEKQLFSDIDLEMLNQIISKNLKSSNISVTDFNKKNLIIHFAIMISRVKENHYISFDSSLSISPKIKKIVDKICDEIESKFNISIPIGERQYIYIHIVINTALRIDDINPQPLENQIKALLEQIFIEYSFDLRNDKILTKDLFNHFYSILSNKKMNLCKKNPLLNTIKTNFPLSYEITLTCVSKVFNESLTEDEIGFISLHIGAAIERCFSGQYNHKKVILVCGSGTATSRMLEARLQAFFQEKIIIQQRLSYDEFKNLNCEELKDIDFVISTIPIQSNTIHVEFVDFTLQNQDVEKISRLLSSTENQLSKKIQKFFDASLFMHKLEKMNKNTLLQEMCHCLENRQIVSSDFYDSVMQREKLAKTNMTSIFAIPHPMTLCSQQSKVAVAILDQPVNWNEESKKVQIVFLLCIKPGESKDIEHLYDLFIEIVNNPRLEQRILKSKTYEEFLQTISHIFDH